MIILFYVLLVLKKEPARLNIPGNHVISLIYVPKVRLIG